MMIRRGTSVANAAFAAEFAAMIESIILRWTCSASFALAIESRSFTAASRFATASAILMESAAVMVGFGEGGVATLDAVAARFTIDSTGAGAGGGSTAGADCATELVAFGDRVRVTA